MWYRAGCEGNRQQPGCCCPKGNDVRFGFVETNIKDLVGKRKQNEQQIVSAMTLHGAYALSKRG